MYKTNSGGGGKNSLKESVSVPKKKRRLCMRSENWQDFCNTLTYSAPQDNKNIHTSWISSTIITISGKYNYFLSQPLKKEFFFYNHNSIPVLKNYQSFETAKRWGVFQHFLPPKKDSFSYCCQGILKTNVWCLQGKSFKLYLPFLLKWKFF